MKTKEQSSLIPSLWSPLFSSGMPSFLDSMLKQNVVAHENKDSIEYEVILPRFNKNEIDIEVCGDMLNITAEKDKEKFHTSFTISEIAEVSHMKAKLENGILHLTCPKRELESMHIPIE